MPKHKLCQSINYAKALIRPKALILIAKSSITASKSFYNIGHRLKPTTSSVPTDTSAPAGPMVTILTTPITPHPIDPQIGKLIVAVAQWKSESI